MLLGNHVTFPTFFFGQNIQITFRVLTKFLSVVQNSFTLKKKSCHHYLQDNVNTTFVPREWSLKRLQSNSSVVTGGSLKSCLVSQKPSLNVIKNVLSQWQQMFASGCEVFMRERMILFVLRVLNRFVESQVFTPAIGPLSHQVQVSLSKHREKY